MIDYLSNYLEVKEIRIANVLAADEIRRKLEASRKLTRERDLEMLLEL